MRTIIETETGALDALLGANVLVRTVTHYHVGQLVAADGDWLVLDGAAWVADTGRFSAALNHGTLSEAEPFPDRVLVSRGAVVDLTAWRHDLPTSVIE